MTFAGCVKSVNRCGTRHDDCHNRAPRGEPGDRRRSQPREGRYAKSFDLTLNNPEAVGLQLTEFAAAGDWRLMFYLRDKVEGLTTADVQRAANTYFKPANRTLGIFVPTKSPDRAEIAEAPDPQSLLRNYAGRKEVAQGEVFDPSPANLDARTTRSALPNGFELALLPKKTRGEAVHLRVTLRYGSVAALRPAQFGHWWEHLLRGTKRSAQKGRNFDLPRRR